MTGLFNDKYNLTFSGIAVLWVGDVLKNCWTFNMLHPHLVSCWAQSQCCWLRGGRRREMWSRCPAFDWDQSPAIKKTRTESYSCSTKALERIGFFLLNYRWLEKNRRKWDSRIAARFKFKRQSRCRGRDTSWRREEPANTKKSGYCSRPPAVSCLLTWTVWRGEEWE